jgi:ribonuclease HI
VSPGTNTRAELLGVWATLFLASKLHIDTLQVLGDSRIVIEWLSSRGELQVVSLLAWKDRIRQLQSTFKKLNYTHIHREYNNSADQLSKATLIKPARVISYNLWIEGHEPPPPPFSIPALRSVYSTSLVGFLDVKLDK